MTAKLCRSMLQLTMRSLVQLKHAFSSVVTHASCLSTIQQLYVCLQDPFGNYVVQYVLELGHVEATATIMRQLYDHYPELAQQKFSSNVVEKCLKLGGPGLAECRERVIRELMVSPLLPRLLQVKDCFDTGHLRSISTFVLAC